MHACSILRLFREGLTRGFFFSAPLPSVDSSAGSLGDGGTPNNAAAAAVRRHHREESNDAAAVVGKADTVLLDFEGLADLQPVGSFYDGGGGPDYRVVFGPAGSLRPGAVGLVGIPRAPSPNTTLWFQGDAHMTVDRGFTALSFTYATPQDWTIAVYGGPNASGAVLTSQPVPLTDPCPPCGGDETCTPCGNAFLGTGTWVNFSLQLAEIARSVRFSSLSGTVPLIDDLELALVPLPQPPTKSPTAGPARVPTSAPASVPACNATTYWVYNADTNAPIRRLVNSSDTCLAHPYNVEIRPCSAPGLLPLYMKLVRIVDGRRVVVHREADGTAPYFLFGDSAATGDVRPSPQQLPNGKYLLTSSVGGRIGFTQACWCPKGKKGCMRK
jgi:hypothetical protein